MKHTLEYKILKHLSDKNNGRFIDISEIESDIDFLKSVIADLKSRELISIEPYPSTSSSSNNFLVISASNKPEKCKIKLSGIEYLDSLEKTEVDFELAKKTLEEFPRTKWFARVGFFIGIGLAILELIKFLIPIMFPSDKT